MKAPQLYAVEDGFLYLGAVPETVMHQHYALQLVGSLDQALQIKTTTQELQAKAIYIPSQVPHLLLGQAPVILLLLLPTSTLGCYYQQKISSTAIKEMPVAMRESLINLGKQHYNQEVTTANMKVAYTTWRQAHLSQNWTPQQLDARIQEVLIWLEQHSDAPILAAKAAQQVHLSTSRFLHLFREETGITYRRMQLWMKLGKAYQQLEQASNLTALAHGAGFADSAHFSRTFKETFGLSPSLLF